MSADDLSKDDFWMKKIKRIFTILYDTDGDGKISAKDFEISLNNIKKALEWGEDDPIVKKAKETLDMFWKKLQEYADQNDDELVSEEEWSKMWQDCIKNKDQSLIEWQKRFMDLMFDFNDTSNDNKIDKSEYTLFWNKAYGINEDECIRAFEKMSPDNVPISKDEFEVLWKDYFLCKDKTVKGNYLFGIPKFL